MNWAELSYELGRVVLVRDFIGPNCLVRVVFGPSCPAPLRPSVVSRPLAEKLLSVYRMKLRIRCNKTTKVFAVSDERNELTTLSEVREAASGLFNIE